MCIRDSYKVTDPDNGNTCWGYVLVEDKKGPDVMCEADTVICFEIPPVPTGSFTVTDNCSNTLIKLSVASEQFIDYGCDSFYQGKVTRHLISTDAWGNASECDKEYYIKRIVLDSILCPVDTAVDCSMEIITIDGKKVSFKDPVRSGIPKIKTDNGLVDLWPNNFACKLTVAPPIDCLLYTSINSKYKFA